MNKGKVLLATSALLLSAGVLVACSGGKSGSSGGQTYSYVYTQDPDTLDYSISNKKSTSEFTGNAVDGLLEVDKYGNLIPSLAKDWTVSKDGLTYTYKLRKGVKWMTSEGEEYGRSQSPRLCHRSQTRGRQEITSDLLGPKICQRLG